MELEALFDAVIVKPFESEGDNDDTNSDYERYSKATRLNHRFEHQSQQLSSKMAKSI